MTTARLGNYFKNGDSYWNSYRADRMRKIVDKFITERIKLNTVPYDLEIMLNAIGNDPDFVESDRNPLKLIDAELLWPDKEYPSLDGTYLTQDDLANPDIAANCSAMDDTAEKFSFVITADSDSLIGYWPSDATGQLHYVYTLDSEGQYNVGEGASLAETLCYAAVVNEDTDIFEDLVHAFGNLGIEVPYKSADNIFTGMEERQSSTLETPQDFRHRMYKHHLSNPRT